MSEVQSRPSAPRGRGSARGGRGGFSARGGRGGRGHATNGDKADTHHTISIEDDGEVGQLKKQYGSKVSTIKEMFPNWTDEDVVFALQETDGDLETTVERISEGETALIQGSLFSYYLHSLLPWPKADGAHTGTISQWGEVSKTKKDRSRSKVKDTAMTTTLGDGSNQGRASRAGRAGFDSSRGGRGRGAERGRGGRGRGASVAHTNGSRKENVDVSTPTIDSTTWETAAGDSSARDSAKPADDDAVKPSEDGWGSTAATAAATTAATAAKVTSSIIPDGVKKSWASMFAPAPVTKKAPEPVAEKYVTHLPGNDRLANDRRRPVEPPKHEEHVEPPTAEPEPSISEPAPVEPAVTTPLVAPVFEDLEVAITPSKDDLTETNLEQVPDVSNPAPTATAASTAASSWDPRSGAGSSTPYSGLAHTQPQAIRPPTSGFQASALKATGTSGRTPSYQRRVLDQEEAVRMPGNREVDRAAVQFGAFNLNGSGDEDVDGEREEAETRTQPPQHSPVAPRASLPPAPQQPVPASVPETFPTPKQAPGLPASTHPAGKSTGFFHGLKLTYSQPLLVCHLLRL